MTQAEELAAELGRAIAQVNQELSTISDDQWSGAVTAAEGWTVGHTAHHIGEGYGQSLAWIEEAAQSGQPVVLDAEVGLPRIHAANARCLEQHGAESRAETLAMLDERGHRLVERVRALTDAQLEAPMMIVMGEERPGRLVALTGALRHANSHLANIRSATGSSGIAR
jgi:hypothetical protein